MNGGFAEWTNNVTGADHMEEEHFSIVMLAVLTILEIILILLIRSKIRQEHLYTEKCEKMSAKVLSVKRERISYGRSAYTAHTFIVEAENGNKYRIVSHGLKAFTINEGNSVNILVPEGAIPRTEEDEYLESLYSEGEDSVNALSPEIKMHLSDYISQKYKDHPELYDISKIQNSSLVSDGSGYKKELIPMCLIAAVIGVIIILSVYFMITER